MRPRPTILGDLLIGAFFALAYAGLLALLWVS